MTSVRMLVVLFAACMLAGSGLRAADTSSTSNRELDSLKKEIDALRKQVSSRESKSTQIHSNVDQAVQAKYAGANTVMTKTGKLQIGGLVHVWYYSIQNDQRGLFDGAGSASLSDSNAAQDNDSFRIRRAELMFTMNIHENISAVVLIDPTDENGSFPLITDNQGGRKRANQVAPEFNNANGPGLGATGSIGGVQTGAGSVPRLLEDAFINYHGVVPHHDFTIGQFKPQVGEESIRSSSQLDFVERSFVGLQNDTWDLGVNVHGSWWDDRFQYTFGIMDGAGNYHGSAGASYNRSDDNDEKDFSYRVLVRPVWNMEKWGNLELGMSSKFGRHGEASSSDPINSPINGLNRNDTWAIFHDAWVSYAPGGPVRGLWLRGEWAWIKDRNAPGTVADDGGNGGTDIGNVDSGSGQAQSNGKPFSVQGWYAALGYHIGKSCFRDSAPGWLKSFEFAFRYDTFENVEIADLTNPSHTDTFKTRVFTGGINYYIKGQNAKIQLNYNSIHQPDGRDHNFHNVDNDSIVVNFQVAF